MNTPSTPSSPNQQAFGRWIVQHRQFVIVIWLLLLIPGIYGATHLSEVLRGEVNSPTGSELFWQDQLIMRDFPEQTLFNVMVVIDSERYTVKEKPYQQLNQKILSVVKQIPNSLSPITHLDAPGFVDRTGHKSYIMVRLKSQVYVEAEELSLKLRERIRMLPLGTDFQVYLTGGPLLFHDSAKISTEDAMNTERKVLPLIFLALVFVFGGVVAALLALLGGMTTTTLTLALLYVIGHFVEITSTAQNITSMIGLGIGVDYALLMISRFREELSATQGNKDKAAINTIYSAGRTIFYAGMVVSIGMATLLIPNAVFMRSLGTSGLLVVAITLALNLTLMPAILSWLGERVNSPRKLYAFLDKLQFHKRFWYDWAKYVMRRPLFFTFVATGMLICLSLYALDLRLWNSNLRLMPKELEARQGFERMIQIDPRFVYTPIILSFESKDKTPIWEQRNFHQIYEFTKVIKQREAILETLGTVNADRPYNDQLALYNVIKSYGGVARMQLFQPDVSFPFLSADETKALVVLFHEYAGYDLTEAGMADLETLQSIRHYRDQNLNQFPNLDVKVGGLVGIPAELQSTINNNWWTVLMGIVVVSYLFTMLSFGSIVLPFKAVLFNLLSITATYGWLVLVFQYGLTASWWGLDPVPGALLIVTPFVLFCIIFSLSMDYEIFLINRIREEYEKTGDHEEAIALGLEKTGGIITSAALIMILVFVGFALSRIITIKEFGLGLATAIFIDATIIRVMIVPALLKLLGPKICWYYPSLLENMPLLNRLFRH